MGKLIEDLLDFSRLGMQAMDRSRIDMESLFREVWGELQEANPDRRINFKMDRLPPVTGDQALIKQLLKNILENALKFTKVREVALIEVGGSVTKAKMSTISKTMALALICRIMPSYSAFFRVCTAPMNTREPGLAWRWFSALSTATAAGYGRRASRTRAPPFILHFLPRERSGSVILIERIF
jgi:signal transduction histidine kinase